MFFHKKKRHFWTVTFILDDIRPAIFTFEKHMFCQSFPSKVSFGQECVVAMHAMKDPKQSIVFNRLLAKAEFCDTPSTSLTFEVASSIAWGPKAQKIIRSKKHV